MQSAPLPAEVLNGHRVFVSNLGADALYGTHADDAYNRFYADLKQWGRYELVDSPVVADLVFALRSAAPLTSVSGTNGSSTSNYAPQLELTISDPNARTVLWTTTVPVAPAIREKSIDASIERSTEALTSKLKLLVGEPVSAPDQAVLTQVTKSHGSRTAIILVASAVGLAVGGALIARHEFNANRPAVPPQLSCAQNPFFCTH